MLIVEGVGISRTSDAAVVCHCLAIIFLRASLQLTRQLEQSAGHVAGGLRLAAYEAAWTCNAVVM